MRLIHEKLDDWASKNPEKLLYSFLDVAGNEIESYSYEAFVRRTHLIASHLRNEHRFNAGDRLLLAYPPGLEIICAFFACARAGFIPVPVYPPSSHGFQAALHKMIHVARDCQAAAILTNSECYNALRLNLARSSVATSTFETGYISSLKWIDTEEFVEPVGSEFVPSREDILFLQYTSGSTSNPKGVIVTHDNILHNCGRVVDHATPIAVTWLPQYHDMGLIGYYLYIALTGGTTYGFSSTSFIQRPALWLETIKKNRATASSAPNFAFEYCLRPGRLSQETIENSDLSSLRFLMTAAEPVNANTFSRFLQTFRPYGLNPESFFVAYGLAENTLAVSNYGRSVLSINRSSLTRGKMRITRDVSDISAATHIVSCGRPLDGIRVRIVDAERHVALDDGNVGEIWISGGSKTAGYWNNSELTEKNFNARIKGGGGHNSNSYLRTGDIGFIHDGELYVCGRSKDMIIIRGQNYYPQDIENIVESTSSLIRKGCVVAFDVHEDQEEAVALVAEVVNPKALPDPLKIATAIRNHLNVEISTIALIAPKSVPKTSSGKIMRHMAKQMWLEGKFRVVGEFSRAKNSSRTVYSKDSLSPFETLKARYNLTGSEPYTLVEAGMDSVDIVVLAHEIKNFLEEKGAGILASQVNIRLIQQISIVELFRLVDHFERSPEAAVLQLRNSLHRIQEERHLMEKQMMFRDRKLTFEPVSAIGAVPAEKEKGGVLLTGGTGFVGPFLLKSLLEQTSDPVYVLIRAADEAQGLDRLKAAAVESIACSAAEIAQMFDGRVIPVCGDLGRENLGLTTERWEFLADKVHTIYHNGAAVNYLFNYDNMRDANVIGTNQVLKLAFEHRQKIFNYVSTTFIFGWAVKDVLYETDSNEEMELLDFGYSQSKWVAERVVVDAAKKGLMTRIFRPALVTPSVIGGGNNFDIAIRLLAFMVNHGIGVEALNQVSFVPADVAANNIVAISNVAETINGTYHVTRDDYANMMDITNIITKLTGQPFELFKLPNFVPEVIKRCTKNDLLYPLLDFLIGSINSISSMEFKQYDSSAFQRARGLSKWGKGDPSLEDTVRGILRFMQKKGLVSVGNV